MEKVTMKHKEFSIEEAAMNCLINQIAICLTLCIVFSKSAQDTVSERKTNQFTTFVPAYPHTMSFTHKELLLQWQRLPI